jgi:hypothetical protein
MSQQKEIVDAVLLLRDDHRVADVWHSADTIAQLLNVPTALFSKALSKSTEFAHIDIQHGGNNCRIVWFKRQLHLVVNGVEKKVSRHFLFFPTERTQSSTKTVPHGQQYTPRVQSSNWHPGLRMHEACCFANDIGY